MTDKYARSVPIFVYHSINARPGPWTVSTHCFEAQMQYLAANGYTALRANALVDFIEGKAKLPRRSVLITFDDGYLDNYVYAFPILERFGLHGVIFAVTGWIGEGPPRSHAGMGRSVVLPECLNPGERETVIAEGRVDAMMLRWSEIKAMEASGVMEAHSHTHSHIHWDRQYLDPCVRVARLEEDLVRSRAALRDHLGRDSRHLCWPFGYYEAGFNETAEKAGFSARYSVHQGVCVPGMNLECLPRIGITDVDANLFALRIWVYSHPWINSLIRVRDLYAPSLRLSKFSVD